MEEDGKLKSCEASPQCEACGYPFDWPQRHIDEEDRYFVRVPRLLTCLHTVCESCLHTARERDGHFTCLTCGEICDISSVEHIASLVVDWPTAQEARQTATWCGPCDECHGDEEAQYWCQSCGASLCEFHKTNHLKSKLTAWHNVVPGPAQSVWCFCDHHHQDVRYGCPGCGRLGCRDCALHGECCEPWVNMESLSPPSAVAGCIELERNVSIDEVLNREKDLCDATTKARDYIRSTTHSLRATIDQREAELLRRVNGYERREADKLEAIKARVNSKRHGIAAADRLLAALNQLQPAQQFALAKAVKRRLDHILSPIDLPPRPNLDRLKVTISHAALNGMRSTASTLGAVQLPDDEIDFEEHEDTQVATEYPPVDLVVKTKLPPKVTKLRRLRPDAACDDFHWTVDVVAANNHDAPVLARFITVTTIDPKLRPYLLERRRVDSFGGDTISDPGNAASSSMPSIQSQPPTIRISRHLTFKEDDYGNGRFSPPPPGQSPSP